MRYIQEGCTESVSDHHNKKMVWQFQTLWEDIKKTNLQVTPTVSNMNRDFAKVDHLRFASDSSLHAQPLQGCCATKYESVRCLWAAEVLYGNPTKEFCALKGYRKQMLW